MTKVLRFITKKGSKAIGPYSTASIYNGVVYLSGQSGVVPETGQLISHNVEEQANQAMKNIETVLGELNTPLSNIIKATIYLKVKQFLNQNMKDFGKVNTVYGSFFKSGEYPSRVAVSINELPRDSLVGIEVCAALGNYKIDNLL